MEAVVAGKSLALRLGVLRVESQIAVLRGGASGSLDRAALFDPDGVRVAAGNAMRYGLAMPGGYHGRRRQASFLRRQRAGEVAVG